MIDRAKCILIQYLNMTEAEAHRYIEKQAMDMRSTKRVIAEGILRTYEIQSEDSREIFLNLSAVFIYKL